MTMTDKIFASITLIGVTVFIVCEILILLRWVSGWISRHSDNSTSARRDVARMYDEEIGHGYARTRNASQEIKRGK